MVWVTKADPPARPTIREPSIAARLTNWPPPNDRRGSTVQAFQTRARETAWRFQKGTTGRLSKPIGHQLTYPGETAQWT